MPHPKILIAIAVAAAPGLAPHPQGMPSVAVMALPEGNPLPTSGNDVMQIAGQASRASVREFSQILTFVSAYGHGMNGGNDKVTSYRAMVAKPGSADAWTDNVLFRHATNDPINTHLSEDDYDMLSANRYGTGVGPAGLSGGVLGNGRPFPAGSAWGRMVTGVATAGGTITGAYGVAAAGKRAYFQRGYVCGFGTVQSCFEDDSSAQVGFRAHGANQDAFNSEHATLKGAAVAMGQAQTITALDPSNARRIVAQLNGVNLVIGDRQTPRAFVMSVLHLSNVPRCPNDSADSRTSGGALAAQDVCVTSGHQLMLAY